MNQLRLTMHDDPVLLYSLDADDQRIGEVRPHLPHAAILRIGAQAWWLVDEVGFALHAQGASIARRVAARLSRPRSHSLREDGGERVLARAQRRWRWSTREDGLVCEVGAQTVRVRSLGTWGGRFALEAVGSAGLGEMQLAGFGRSVQARDLPFPVAEAAFLLYATHCNFGRDVTATGSSE